jgi:hypothetical protein
VSIPSLLFMGVLAMGRSKLNKKPKVGGNHRTRPGKAKAGRVNASESLSEASLR